MLFPMIVLFCLFFHLYISFIHSSDLLAYKLSLFYINPFLIYFFFFISFSPLVTELAI